MKIAVNIIWFRRDLRLNDHAALYYALKSSLPVIPIFIFDKNILDKLEDKKDRRVEFIHTALALMQKQLMPLGTSLQVFYEFPGKVFSDLFEKYEIKNIFTNHDYEPYALERDASIEKLGKKYGVPLQTFKDHVIFEKDEINKEDGKPYTIFTPYANKWKNKLTDHQLKPYPTEKYFNNFLQQEITEIPSLNRIGFQKTDQPFPAKQPSDQVIRQYTERRNFPAFENGTSKVGVHLRFGTISIRQLALQAKELNTTYLNELIWRDFYQMILWHFPQVGKGKSFKPVYEMIEWRNKEDEFTKWCDGMTGYPIVDAGMRELNKTGFMHNRVRMITASFLIKHLLIDWRWGEAYFANKLLDFDLASNNGGWQWASSSGCDAAPYFRIFNPSLQTEKFDKNHLYIKKWVPEYQELSYPRPIVVHELARKRVLEVYSKALKK